MSLIHNINLGVHAPVGDAARVNIQAQSDTVIHTHNPPHYTSQAGVSTADKLTINERSLVFQCSKSSDRQIRLAARDTSNGLRQPVARVFQCFDGLSEANVQSCEFVGVAVSALNGLDALNGPNASHAATAVRISGTITAQNPSSEVISPMTPVVWELPAHNKPAEIKGIKPVFLPNIKPLHKARAKRIVDRIYPILPAKNPAEYITLPNQTTSNGYARDATRRFLISTIGSPTVVDDVATIINNVGGALATKAWPADVGDFQAASLVTTACFSPTLGDANSEAAKRKFLEETIQFVLDLVEDDERHKIGICLGTQNGQAHLLLKH